MYVKSEKGNYVTFFKDENGKQTEKMFSARISEGIKVGEQYGKPVYEFESWNARFVGKALEKAKQLESKTRIRLTEWNVHNPYDKERKKSYPYILVMDFETMNTEETTNDTGNTDDEDIPF